jgi:hypothetical protein
VAKSAVTELTDHIEAIRQEAYNEGYAAAMRAIVEFSTSGTATVTSTKATVVKSSPRKSTSTTTAAPTATTGAAEPRRQTRAPAKPAVRHTRRGDIARHIAEALMTLPDRTGPAAAIKKALAEKGHEIPYTSIRHGLGQLQARGEASLAGDGKTWSYTATQQ